jgi:hypothetical protein
VPHVEGAGVHPGDAGCQHAALRAGRAKLFAVKQQRRLEPLLGTATALSCLAMLARVAAADDTTPSPATAMLPLLTPRRLSLSPNEPTSSASSLTPALVSLPLKLALMGSVFPAMPGIMGEDCRDAAEASGNTIWGFSTQHAVFVPLTPRLTLHGFSQMGCAVDSGMGGAVTYALPLDRDLALVGSAGLFAQPNPLSVARIKADARVDLLMNRSNEHPFAIGLDLRRQGFSFTSAW